jgi:hypothetical protein
MYSCGQSSPKWNDMSGMSKNVEALNMDSTKTYFFGHQSVGVDLMDGVQSIDSQLVVKDVHLSDTITQQGVFYHAKIGQNRNPQLKVAEFCEFVSHNAQNLSVAGMKFCYVDITSSTNTDSLFIYYQQKMNELAQLAPNVRLFHVTVPLRSVKDDFKSSVKEWLLNKDYGKKDNIARERFNELMREHYADNELFDLAKFEAQLPNGSINSFRSANGECMALCQEYTEDGGHLNQTGKTMMGARFIQFLKTFK